MSLEKEIEKYLESRGWFKEGNITGHFDYNGLSEYIKDFATQQTEKLREDVEFWKRGILHSNDHAQEIELDLQQTKEKLKRCLPYLVQT